MGKGEKKKKKKIERNPPPSFPSGTTALALLHSSPSDTHTHTYTHYMFADYARCLDTFKQAWATKPTRPVPITRPEPTGQWKQP